LLGCNATQVFAKFLEDADGNIPHQSSGAAAVVGFQFNKNYTLKLMEIMFSEIKSKL